MSNKTATQTTPVAEAQEKPPMKTLANCTPVEFLRQTNKIKHAVSELFDTAGIAEIRKRMPVLTGNETPEEKQTAMQKQGVLNFSDILDALLDANAEGTAALIGMMCFRDPEEIRNDTMMDHLGAVMDLLENKAVKDFLLLLLRLATSNTDG